MLLLDYITILKKKCVGQYVKETYSLFLLRCISVLKMYGRLSFIIPDTYLFLNMHSKLRKLLLTGTKIEEILIFPSRFFPGVNFGYSDLSIITLQRCSEDEALNNTVKVIKGFKSSSEFNDILENIYPKNLNIFRLRQGDILSNKQHRFILADEGTRSMIKNPRFTLGDVADVVTGFCTGDNLRFIKALSKEIKGAKGYDVVDETKIHNCISVEGVITADEGYIPYIKRAPAKRYVKAKDEWYVQWDNKVIEHYTTNRKSRFQNSEFYFNTGIGIQKNKASSIRAFLMENRVFDQSIVGIFPKDKTKTFYILALMNSDVINDLIHIINPTVNNTSNYVKLIPYIEPDRDTLETINRLIESILDSDKQGTAGADGLHDKVNAIISKTYAEYLGQQPG